MNVNGLCREFEAMAIGVLAQCYSKNVMRSHDLLIRNVETWGDTTLFALADSADLMDFLHTTAAKRS